MIEFLQHFSAQLDEPLFLLDKELSDCLPQLASCVDNAMKARKYIIFGVFNKSSLTGGQNISVRRPDLCLKNEYIFLLKIEHQFSPESNCFSYQRLDDCSVERIKHYFIAPNN